MIIKQTIYWGALISGVVILWLTFRKKQSDLKKVHRQTNLKKQINIGKFYPNHRVNSSNCLNRKR